MPPHHGGVERVADLLTRTYAASGHDVAWVATASPERPGVLAGEDGRRLVRIAATNALEERWGMPYPIPAPRGIAALAREVRGSDLVHVHDCLYLTSLEAVTLAGRRPLLLTQHVGSVSFGALVDPFETLAYRAIGRAVARRATAVAFASASVRDWWSRSIDRHLAGLVIPNGVDLTRFRPADAAEQRAAREELDVRAEGTVALFVGRLVAKKHVSATVAAIAASPPWHLLVVGDGPERRHVLEAAAVTHLRSLPYDRMPLAYRAADAFVLPSVGEGAPLALLEALATGLPAVVSTDPAFGRAAAAGTLRVTPDPAGIAAALRELSNPAARADRGRAARSWALANASDDAFVARYLALIRELLAGGG